MIILHGLRFTKRFGRNDAGIKIKGGNGMKPQYSKIKQFDQILNDFKGLESDEELLLTFGDRQYIVKVANEIDIQIHKETGYLEKEQSK